MAGGHAVLVCVEMVGAELRGVGPAENIPCPSVIG